MLSRLTGIEQAEIYKFMVTAQKNGVNETGAIIIGERNGLTAVESVYLFNAMPTLIREQNIDIANTLEVQLLSELIDGDLTVFEFETRSNSTIPITGARIGLDAVQIIALNEAVVYTD